MYCSTCGTQLAANARFCASCGAPAPATPPPARVPPPAFDTPFHATPPASDARAVRWSGAVYAGFWKRTAAYLVDTIILFAIGLPLGLLIYAMSDDDGGAQAVINLAAFVVTLLYFTLMESGSKQATWGKQLLGIQVTDEHGGRISFGRAVGRYFAKILSWLILLIGYFMAGWTKRKQGLHDMIASTLVVNKAALEAGALGHDTPRGMSGGAIAAIVVAALFIPVTGILAAIAIPQYQDYVTRARVAQTQQEAMVAAQLLGAYYETRKDLPDSLEDLGFQPPAGLAMTMDPNNGVLTAGRANVTLKLTPSLVRGKVVWQCEAPGLRPSQAGSCKAD